MDVADQFETDIYEGYGRFVDETSVEVIAGEDTGATIRGEAVLIATGSSPRIAPLDGIEDVRYETSETILQRDDRPESVVMIGGGYIGLGWGQILHHMGTDVTILQRSAHVLSKMDGLLGRELQRSFEDEGIEVQTDVDIDRVATTESVAGTCTSDGTDTGVIVTATVDGTRRKFEATDLFVATGVTPNSEDLGLADIGVATDENGAIVVDEKFQTANPAVYAAGDVIGEPMLETVAAKEGNHAVRNAFGNEGVTIEYDAVPSVVFTSPEVATVGRIEREYMSDHGTCACRTVEMDDVPKANVVEDTRGLLQVVKHHETDEIVGVHIVGRRAADMIPEATLAVKFGLTVDDFIDTIHPFPTFSEAFKHACQAFRRDTSTMSWCVE